MKGEKSAEAVKVLSSPLEYDGPQSWLDQAESLRLEERRTRDDPWAVLALPPPH